MADFNAIGCPEPFLTHSLGSKVEKGILSFDDQDEHE